MKILVLNSGSSSIKFQLIEMTGRSVIASGIVEKIGEETGHTEIHTDEGSEHLEEAVADHGAGLKIIQGLLKNTGSIEDFDALGGIGHRVVHGGEEFHEPVRIDDHVMDVIAALSPFAPLHNPANLQGVRVAMALAPHVPQVAVFDTAFHQSIPPEAYLYALPKSLYEHEGIRRYGFHGTSHHYVAKEAAVYLGKPLESLNLITLHLGNGASVTAIKKGKSVDTSMGMTPLEGLVMGTRCGDMDPEILLYLHREKGMKAPELERLVNKESGLKGLCGTNDMREVIERMEAGDAAARTAFNVFDYRVRKYLGSYCTVLGHLDAVVFTGGIGEHAPQVREAVCAGLEEIFGITVDPKKNEGCAGGICPIHRDEARVAVLVVPTNEELEIAIQTEAVVKTLEKRR
jgi:acetate kinase